MVTKSPTKRKSRKELVSVLQSSRSTQTEEICLVPGCQSVVAARGMCLQCYSTAKRNIQRGNATWDEFIAAGLAREPNGKSSLVMDALRSYRETATKVRPGKAVHRKRAASNN